jgi:hypothetical protein
MNDYLSIDYYDPGRDENLTYKFEYGNVYIFFSDEPGIQEKFFSSASEKVFFINSFFKSAIKVPTYFEKNKRKLLEMRSVLNASNMFPLMLGDYGIYDKILLILLAELKTAKNVVIETAGLSEASIVNLISFSSMLMKLNSDKLIVLVDNNYSDMNLKLIMKIEESNIGKNLIDWIPVEFKHNIIKFSVSPHVKS